MANNSFKIACATSRRRRSVWHQALTCILSIIISTSGHSETVRLNNISLIDFVSFASDIIEESIVYTANNDQFITVLLHYDSTEDFKNVFLATLEASGYYYRLSGKVIYVTSVDTVRNHSGIKINGITL